jgi:hypothetical protein
MGTDKTHRGNFDFLLSATAGIYFYAINQSPETKNP